MAKKKVKAEEQKTETGIRYKQMTVEILFTDGDIKTATFYRLKDIWDYLDDTVGFDYANTVRIELF